MPIKIEREWEVPEADRKITDRADYTMEQSNINVDVDVQAERVEGITFANSTDPIASGEEYDSDWQVAGEFVYIRGNVFSSATGTIYIEQSNDGIILAVQSTQSYTGGAYNGGFVENIVAPQIRVRFVPAAAAATFRVWARLSME